MDLVSAARTARESLARGLGALQGPGVPPQLMVVAAPVAQAMGALHRIETSAGAALGEAAPAALGSVRQALALLQAQQVTHPAVDQAMEAIASSLGLVHQLSQTPQPAPAQQPAVSPYAGTLMAQGPQAGYSPGTTAAPLTQPSQQMPYPTRPEPQPQVTYPNAPGSAPVAARAPAAQPVAAQPVPLQAPAQLHYTQPSAQQPHAPAPAPAPPAYQQPYAPAPAAHPSPPAYPVPPAYQPAPELAAAVAPAPGQAAPPPAAGGPQRVEAALGAHSATNFYKGLSGNDIIESGGIFVGTYQIPDIGSNLLIKVSLPGGYEFEALGVVRWTREAPQSGAADVSPGFGAQFTQISPEGRQLVYRYVRNREPLFHDDF